MTTALDAVRLVAARPDPLEPLAVGVIAARLGVGLSLASRLCSDLERTGLVERAGGYGSYRLGARAIRISGRAAAPIAQELSRVLTRAAQQTGETVCLAARAAGEVRVVATVESGWTLYAPAAVGEVVDEAGCAILQAVDAPLDVRSSRGKAFESATGMRIEVAKPVRDPSDEIVAVVAIRLPRNRTRAGSARARRAVDEARRSLELAIAAAYERLDVEDPREVTTAPSPTGDGAQSPNGIEAAARVLEHLAAGPASVAQLARVVGARADRVQRLVDSCVAAGAVTTGPDGDDVRLLWSVHGWHRAATEPILVRTADELVAATSRATGQCAFLTALRNMRSVTLVEKLAPQPDGLAMIPWLGRPCPIVFADGGPTLLLDFDIDEIPDLIPGRPLQSDVDELIERVRRVAARDVLSKESAEEGGQIAVSAPVRDSSGMVVAAACIVGASDAIRPRVAELEVAVRQLAADVSGLLGRAA